MKNHIIYMTLAAILSSCGGEVYAYGDKPKLKDLVYCECVQEVPNNSTVGKQNYNKHVVIKNGSKVIIVQSCCEVNHFDKPAESTDEMRLKE